MKIGFIFVLFNTPTAETDRLRREIKLLNLSDYQIYSIDNSQENKGYAAGVNKGIAEALNDRCDLLIVANPDISFDSHLQNKLSQKILEEGASHLDIWGYAMKQESRVFYGGTLDRWRMSGGLVEKKPKRRFSSCDFVSGSLMVIKSSVVEKIGLLNEEYFMYYEDVEYCLRARKHGLKVGLDVTVQYEHFELSQTNKEKKMYLVKNRMKLLMQYGNLSQKIYELIRLPLTIIEERQVIPQIVRKDAFFFNFASLNISSFINKLLFFVLFIFLFKYLGVKQYGVYTFVWAHTAILSPLLDLGTTSYGIIYSPNEPLKKLTTLISLRTTLSILVFFLTIALAFIFHYNSTTILFIIFTSVIIFSNALSGSFLIIASLIQKAYITSLVSFIFNTVLVITQIVLLISYKSVNAIFISIFVFYSLYTLINAYLIKKYIPNVSFFQIDFKQWKQIISKSYIFVLIGLFAGLYYKIDVFLLNFMKGETAVGVYAAGYKFLEAFLFIPASYNITATPIYAKLQKESTIQLKKRIKRDFVILSLIGFGVSIAVFFIAPIVIPLVLNRPIGPSIPVLKIVIFALPFTLISSIFFNTIYVLNKAKFVALLFLIQTGIVIVLNYILIPNYSYIASAYITVFAEAMNLLILIAAVTFFLKKQ